MDKSTNARGPDLVAAGQKKKAADQLVGDERIAIKLQLEEQYPSAATEMLAAEDNTRHTTVSNGNHTSDVKKGDYYDSDGDDEEEELYDDFNSNIGSREKDPLLEEQADSDEAVYNLQKLEIEEYFRQQAASYQNLQHTIEENIDIARQGPIRMGAQSYAAEHNQQRQQHRQVELILPESLISAASNSTATTRMSTAEITPTTSTDNTPTSDAKMNRFLNKKKAPIAPQHKSRPGPNIWLDISRPEDGDGIFLHLLGRYDPQDLKNEEQRYHLDFPGVYDPLSLSSNPRVLSEAAMNATLTRDDVTLSYDANPQNIQALIEKARCLQISLREAYKPLPFAVKFQLERCILSDKTYISLQVRQKPQSQQEQDRRRIDRTLGGRKLMLVMIRDVIPALLRLSPQLAVPGDDNQNKSSFLLGLQEAFADEIWSVLLDVKKAIHLGKSVAGFINERVERALHWAQQLIQKAEKLNCTTEEQLSHPPDKDSDPDGYLLCIQKRSLWPMAEYRCQFSPDGRVLPSELTLMNKDTCSNYKRFEDALKYSTAQTRRALRELAWNTRDRFLCFSDIPLHDIFQQNLVNWLKDEPGLCQRRYLYLFDKGVGKPSLWLFAPSSELSRDAFLNRLGDFTKVDAPKVGDRVSLGFTVTKPLVQLNLEQIVPIDEVIRNDYRFTDGCGVMGINIAKKILAISDGQSVPGSIQIRIGGVKGMLTLRKDFPKDKIGIRPSMCKFCSNHRLVEVKRVALAKTKLGETKPKLFNQILLIMHHLGVSNRSFLDLQRRVCAEMAAESDPLVVELLREPIDYVKISKYIKKCVKEGIKYNNEPFTVGEMGEIIQQMKLAKEKVNLRCSLALMLGVPDEHDYLEENQVLVGNGMIVGKVLICRPPCVMPGDIQLVTAVPGKNEEPFTNLKDTLVLSCKGSRPLADMLAGGDYDGDEYYCIDEQCLVEELKPVKAFDFGSQKSGITERIELEDAFSKLSDVSAFSAPNIQNQLCVFNKVLELGMIVSRSADAWFYVADREGPYSPRAQRMARLHIKSLDARKQAHKFEKEELDELDCIHGTYKAPHWMERSTQTGDSGSILAVLYDKWKEHIEHIENAQRNRCCQIASELADDKTHVSEVSEDSRLNDLLPLTEQHEMLARRSMPNKEPVEVLVDVTFGEKYACFEKLAPIKNFESLTMDDLNSLAKMVVFEFQESLERGWNEALDIFSANDSPNNFDVFLLGNSIVKDIAICRPYQGEQQWVFRNNRQAPIEPIDFRRRLTSLSGFSRILESFRFGKLTELMRQAMRRENLVNVVDCDNVPIDPTILSSLNKSQRMAVATVVSPSFTTGFFAIQGPPGTGKTSTIIGMLLAKGSALVLAPSNPAVANIALKLIAEPSFNLRNVVVWGSNCNESVHFLNPERRMEAYARFLARYNEADDPGKPQKLFDFATSLRLDNADTVTLEEIYSICGDPDALKAVSSASIVLCTLNTAGSTPLRKAVKSKFDLVILDEASQCSEAEFYIATTFPGIKRVVVVGDPQQLPATVLSQECLSFGYGKSFLSQASEYRPSKVHLLDTQYRMDPILFQFANEAFYFNRVFSSDSVKDREPKVEYPFQLISTVSDCGQKLGEEERRGSSWFNKYEVSVVMSILKNDPDILRVVEATGEDLRIIVITPYKAQVEWLKRALKRAKALRHLRRICDISTVDSFQGQEADIVIVSIVRTEDVGFVDNANRLCVALTRARQVLRVVGDVSFFKSIDTENSTLRKLAMFSEREGAVTTAETSGLASWERKYKLQNCSWKPVMTAKFHYCLRKLPFYERNIALNTLLAVATPDLSALQNNKSIESNHPRWHMSALRNGGDVYVTWIAKRIESVENTRHVGQIEAHIVGSRDDSVQFQNITLVPKAACVIESDLSRPREGIETEFLHATEVDVRRWILTDELQNAILGETIDVLPEGLLDLDEQQGRILNLRPPLVLESRSGTGKTNVLFQHAFSYALDLSKEAATLALGNGLSRGRKAICFVTVSSNLRQKLEEMYNDVADKVHGRLPLIRFFSFRDLLQVLLEFKNVKSMDVKASCNFWHYVYARKSHQDLAIEPFLLESEIGGVIQGSLLAAEKKRPLTRAEYMKESRSNISIRRSTEEGLLKRQKVYDEYERYKLWKDKHSKYDVGDIVLELIKCLQKTDELFDSAYLDEVQDFSYAAIFLLFSAAGKANARWVAAGDTAQMISPGCSFKFAGLNDTLCLIKNDTKIPPVEKLTRNYRMTKGVLMVGNAVLGLLKKNFPDHIEYATPEKAMKDLGLKVTLVDWKNVISSEGVKFGIDQAIVYAGSSSQEEEELAEKMRSWANHHPLTFSALDAKGLEFDDVVVVFQKNRNAWRIDGERVECLRLLRELYVAVTRAKRRVVILVNGKQTDMKKFFEDLLDAGELEWTEASVILLEFDNETTASQWLVEGIKYFNQEKFSLAKSCFNAARNYAWSYWSEGRELLNVGRKGEAKVSFRSSSTEFLRLGEYEKCLDVIMFEILELPPWDQADDPVLESALEKCPNHLPREKVVKIALYRDNWTAITVEDLLNPNIASIFRDKRGDSRLKKIIRDDCGEAERRIIRNPLPLPLGDYYLSVGNLTDAVNCFLQGNDQALAERATIRATSEAKEGRGDLLSVVQAWQHASQNPTNSSIKLLLSLFNSPEQAAEQNAKNCMNAFGANIVKLAVGADATLLHQFDRDAFQEDVERALMGQYATELIKVVEWYYGHGDKDRALAFAKNRLKSWSDDELLNSLIRKLSLFSNALAEELASRDKLLEAVRACLEREDRDFEFAEKLSNMVLDSAEPSGKAIDQLRGLWRPILVNNRIVREAASRKAGSSLIYLLLSLFSDPESTGQRFSEQCMQRFGQDIIKEAVDSHGFNEEKRYSILAQFDSEAFQSERPTRGPEPEHPRRFSVNQRVRMHGLQSQSGKQLNGKRGVVKNLNKDGRYGVLIDDETKLKAFKEDNLVEEPQSSAASIPDANSSMSYSTPRAATFTSSDEEYNEDEDDDSQRRVFDRDDDDDDDSGNDTPPPLLDDPRDDSSDDESEGSVPPLDSDDSSSSSGGPPNLIEREYQSSSGSSHASYSSGNSSDRDSDAGVSMRDLD